MDIEIKEKLMKILGDAYVEDNPRVLEAYGRDHSLLSPGMPDLIVSPANAEEVQKIIQLANEEKIPVIPVSSSIHFHGSTIPKMGGMIMDLRRIEKILNINT